MKKKFFNFSYHGFVLDHNTHDCVLLNLQISKTNIQKDEIQKNLKKFKIRTTSFCISPKKITNTLLEYIRIVFDGGDTRSTQRTRLGQLCQERLINYPTTIKEDELLLQKDYQGENNYKILTAIKFRLSEKKILKEMFDMYGGGGGGGGSGGGGGATASSSEL